MKFAHDPNAVAGPARGRAAISGARADSGAAGRAGSPARYYARLLNETCGAEGWAKAPAGTTGVVNDAMALYFEDAAVAQAFVARFCCGYRIEPIAGALAIRDDAVKTRRVAAVHKAP